MEQKERCLIAIDLDNTVLSELFSLDSKSVIALIRAQQAGHLVMIATARPGGLTMPYYRILGLNTPVSTMNGSYLCHPDDPAFQPRYDLIGEEAVAQFLRAAKAADAGMICIDNDMEIYATKTWEPRNLYVQELFRHSKAEINQELRALPAAYVTAGFASREQADFLLEQMKDCGGLRMKCFADADGTVNVSARSATTDKWESVRYVAEYYGILPENIYTFGDEKDDLQMICRAGHGFAMCNGNETVKAAALEAGGHITELPCGQGGVAREIYRRILKTEI